MRSVFWGLLCAGIIAGWSASAMAAEGVRVWTPTPVAPQQHPAGKIASDLKVANVVVIGRGYRGYPYLTSRDWSLDGSSSGYTRVYSGPLYPF